MASHIFNRQTEAADVGHGKCGPNRHREPLPLVSYRNCPTCYRKPGAYVLLDVPVDTSRRRGWEIRSNLHLRQDRPIGGDRKAHLFEDYGCTTLSNLDPRHSPSVLTVRFEGSLCRSVDFKAPLSAQEFRPVRLAVSPGRAQRLGRAVLPIQEGIPLPLQFALVLALQISVQASGLPGL